MNCETYDAEEVNAAYDGVVYTEDDFGTDGVVSDVTVIDLLGITDSVKDKSYMRIAESLEAGTDYMLGGSGLPDGAWSVVSEDELLGDAFLVAQARESYHRYLYTFADSALFDGYAEDAGTTGAVWWDAALNILSVVFGVLTLLMLVCWVLAYTRPRSAQESGTR